MTVCGIESGDLRRKPPLGVITWRSECFSIVTCALRLCCLGLLDAGGPEAEGVDIGTSSFMCPMVSGRRCSVLGASVVSLCPCSLSQPHSTHREASRPTVGSGLGAPLEVGDRAARRQGSHELSTHPSLPQGRAGEGQDPAETLLLSQRSPQSRSWKQDCAGGGHRG